MSEQEMIDHATCLGYKDPMDQVASNTLRVFNPKGSDVVFLRFVEGFIYEYTYSQRVGMY